jgi:hypothetical protein
MSKSRITKLISLSLPFALALVISSCGNSSESTAEVPAVQENLTVRTANCELISAWIAHREDPMLEDFWGSKNTYGYYEEAENFMWQKLQSGDASYDAMMGLRALQYGQDWYNAPALGGYITADNRKTYSSETDPQTEDESWEIIKNVTKFCTQYSDNEVATEFAYALVM